MGDDKTHQYQRAFSRLESESPEQMDLVEGREELKPHNTVISLFFKSFLVDSCKGEGDRGILKHQTIHCHLTHRNRGRGGMGW